MTNHKMQWTASDTTGALYLGVVEFKDNKGEYHNFEVLSTPDRLIFGGAVNVGFLESGFITRDGERESDNELLQEMLSDLETYYNDGPQFVSRIVCNERM